MKPEDLEIVIQYRPNDTAHVEAPYLWTLREVGNPKPLEEGTGEEFIHACLEAQDALRNAMKRPTPTSKMDW